MSRQSDRDNHANQLNPNNAANWQSRDDKERPTTGKSEFEMTTRTGGARSPV